MAGVFASRINSPALERLAAQIVPVLQRHGVLSAAVFGSMARGEANAASDLDLLVDYAEDVDLFDVQDLRAELEKLLGRQVDLVSRNYIHRRIKEAVLHEAVPLY